LFGSIGNLLTRALIQGRSTAQNNPLLWWAGVLVRSAVGRGPYFISQGQRRRASLPLQIDLRERGDSLVHYGQVLVIQSSFCAWQAQKQWLAEVEGNLNKVDSRWIDGEGPWAQPSKTADDRLCEGKA
jgi:hypothetical protein